MEDSAKNYPTGSLHLRFLGKIKLKLEYLRASSYNSCFVFTSAIFRYNNACNGLESILLEMTNAFSK
jgi:hypothetical protein